MLDALDGMELDRALPSSPVEPASQQDPRALLGLGWLRDRVDSRPGSEEAMDMPALVVGHQPSAEALAEGAAPSIVAAIAGRAENLQSLDPDLGWGPPDEGLESVVWTDSKGSLLSVLW